MQGVLYRVLESTVETAVRGVCRKTVEVPRCGGFV